MALFSAIFLMSICGGLDALAGAGGVGLVSFAFAVVLVNVSRLQVPSAFWTTVTTGDSIDDFGHGNIAADDGPQAVVRVDFLDG